ncbi:MAG TPA: OB-fold domain-containing protein, partial [Ilumatobacteraceae bacterium]
CWSAEVGAVEVRGEGVVELSTVLHVGSPKPDVDYTAGYRLCAVRLDEAPTFRVTAPLRDLPVDAEAIGIRVRLSWSIREGSPLPVFVPVEDLT